MTNYMNPLFPREEKIARAGLDGKIRMTYHGIDTLTFHPIYRVKPNRNQRKHGMQVLWFEHRRRTDTLLWIPQPTAWERGELPAIEG